MFTNPGYNGICCNLRPCAAAQKINEVKNMFLSVILTIAAAYMALQCGLTAFSVPFASWTWLSWLYLAMAAVMIGVCVVSARRAVRAYKKQAEKIKEEQARELEKLHAKRRALYLDEDIDIEAEAAKAEAARLAAQAEEAAGADAPDGGADDGGKRRSRRRGGRRRRLTRAAPGKGTRFPEEIALRIPRPPAHNNSTGVFKMQNQTNKESQNRHGQPSAHGKQHKAHGHVEQARRDGQTATSENVYESLAENAWFPALYADEVLMDDFGPDFPEV